MPAGERARRRAEREREAAAVAAVRAAEAEKAARRRERRDRFTGWLPRRSGQSGTLAARRRQAAGLVVAFVVAVNLLFWLAGTGWAARALVLLLSLLATPIVLHLMSRRPPT